MADALPPSWQPALEPVLQTPEARRLGGLAACAGRGGESNLPAARVAVEGAGADPARQGQSRDSRAGSLSRAGPGARSGLFGARRRPGPAVAGQYLQGTGERPRRAGPAARQSREDGRSRACCCSTMRSRSRPGRPVRTRTAGGRRSPTAAVAAVAAREEPSVFILWGSHAKKKAMRVPELAGNTRHLVLTAPHPSPLSAHAGFFGSKPFSKANAFLESPRAAVRSTGRSLPEANACTNYTSK